MSTASATLAAPSPSHSPRLLPLFKSRTTGTIGSPGTSGTSTPNEHSAPPSIRGDPASSTASPSSSRRPSLRTSKDFPEEYRQQLAIEQLPPAASSSSSHHAHHHHHHHHHRPHIHRHHHNSQHHTNSLGHLGSHSTTVAALAAAATAVAAASPTGTAIPNSMSTGSGDSTTDRAPAEDPAERKISAASSSAPPGDASSKAAAASSAAGVALPSIDSDTVAAVAATLQKMQRRQSRKAARVLQSAVSDIDGLSTTTSQRLDAAYGSILGRISTLQDTVLALRSLAAAARETNDRFTSEADSIARSIDHQIVQLEGGDKADRSDRPDRSHKKKVTPNEQQARLVQLSERVKAGRQSIESLSERVERVRARVDRWERADKGWQDRTRTRIRVVWVIILGVVVAGIAVYVVVTRVTPATGTAAPLPDNDAVLLGPPDLSKLAAPSTASEFHLTFPNHTKTKTAPDGELQHLFDEL